VIIALGDVVGARLVWPLSLLRSGNAFLCAGGLKLKYLFDHTWRSQCYVCLSAFPLTCFLCALADDVTPTLPAGMFSAVLSGDFVTIWSQNQIPITNG
jgi:hypothetical protein